MIEPKTRSHIREIQTKLKSKATGIPEFQNSDAVIDYAVKSLYDKLKKDRFLWNALMPQDLNISNAKRAYALVSDLQYEKH